jgi:glycosyltransferase involved in cell wall biosynthesis
MNAETSDAPRSVKRPVSKVSIVTVTYNARDTLRLTMESAIRQSFPDIDHVIIDGGSRDGTQDIAREYELGTFVSEPDKGVYDAMDKGAKAAKGDIVIFLNAGDTFFDDNVCADVARFFDETDADIVFGNILPVYLRYDDEHDHGAFKAGQLLDLSYMRNRGQLRDESIHHQATFFRSTIFATSRYACAEPAATGEYHLLASAVFGHGARIRYIPRNISRFVLGGISTRDFKSEWKRYVDAREILRRLYFDNQEAISPGDAYEFHGVQPPVATVQVQEQPPNRPVRAAIKRWLKRGLVFRAYERLMLGMNERLTNRLMPRIEDLQEMQTQRLFNDLRYVIEGVRDQRMQQSYADLQELVLHIRLVQRDITAANAALGAQIEDVVTQQRRLSRETQAATRRLSGRIQVAVRELFEESQATTLRLSEESQAVARQLFEKIRAATLELSEESRELSEESRAATRQLSEESQAATRQLSERTQAVTRQLEASIGHQFVETDTLIQRASEAAENHALSIVKHMNVQSLTLAEVVANHAQGLVERMSGESELVLGKLNGLADDQRGALNTLLINQGRALIKLMGGDEFAEHGFKIFSQWDEDGLIQFLVDRCEIPNRTFVEIGVNDYTEANTRLLAFKDNWSGVVIEGNADCVNRIKSADWYWKYTVNAVHSFVAAENINATLTANGMTDDIGLLSIDVDGVDYWIWKAIEVIRPRIVICEFNGLFGPTAAVTVPYAADFDRVSQHYSSLYAGASLQALIQLGKAKGYTFVGTNVGGNNAFFVRKEVFKKSGLAPSKRQFFMPLFREARNPDGSLSYIGLEQGKQLIADLEVVDITSDKRLRVGDIR